MLYVRWILVIAVMILIVVFAIQNMEDTVVIKLWKYQTVPLSAIIVIGASFLMGNLVWIVIMVVQHYRLKKDLRQVSRENAVLKDELANLRNISIDDAIKTEEE